MNMKLNAQQLKLIAIAAMTVDHIAWLIFPGYPREPLPLFLHTIGRLTCPIMCFFIAEGYHHTRNLNRYMTRMFAFAVISHFAYLFASDTFTGWNSFLPFYNGNVLNQTSVMWPLAWGLVMLRVVNSSCIPKDWQKTMLVLLICLITFPSDWSCIASLCIMAFGTNRGNFRTQMFWLVVYVFLYALVYFFFIDPVYGALQLAVILAIPLLKCYNGERGRSRAGGPILKWMFYIYYPFHLFVIGLIRWLG